jgi:hypothetical protein
MDFAASFTVGQRWELQADYWTLSTPASCANTTAAEDPTHRVPCLIPAGMVRTGTGLWHRPRSDPCRAEYKSPRMSDSWQSFSSQTIEFGGRPDLEFELALEEVMPDLEEVMPDLEEVMPDLEEVPVMTLVDFEQLTLGSHMHPVIGEPVVGEEAPLDWVDNLPWADGSVTSDDSIWSGVSESGDEESEDSVGSGDA